MRTVYVASQCEEGGIYRLSLSDDGKLSFAEKYESPKPAYFCMDGDYLYALLREPFLMSSGLQKYRMLSDDSLEKIGDIQSVHGTIAAHVYARGSRVFVANYINGTAILMPDKMYAFDGYSHPHCVTPAPDGKYVVITDLGTDRVYVFDMDLDYVSDCRLPKGSGPRHLVFSHDGKWAYCANQDSSTVSVMSYCGGKLEHIESVSTLPENFKGRNEVSAIRLSDDGQRLYVSNRGHDSAAVFDVCGNKLEIDGFIPCFGKEPREMTLVDNFLLFGNIISGDITVFDVSGEMLPASPVDKYIIAQPWGIIAR